MVDLCASQVENWNTSKKGNLHRTYRHVTLTVFTGNRGGFVVCIAGPKKIGQKFIDLGAGNLEDALKEAIKKSDLEIQQNRTLNTYVKNREVALNG